MLTEIRKTVRALDHAQGVFYNQLFSIFLEGQLYISLAIHTHCHTHTHSYSLAVILKVRRCYVVCCCAILMILATVVSRGRQRALQVHSCKRTVKLCQPQESDYFLHSTLPFLTSHLSEVRTLAGATLKPSVMDAALRSSPAVRGSVRRTGGLLLAGRDHNGCWSTCDVHKMAAHVPRYPLQDTSLLVTHHGAANCSSLHYLPPIHPPPFPHFLG